MSSIKTVQAKSGNYPDTSTQQYLFHCLRTLPAVTLEGACQDYETVTAVK